MRLTSILAHVLASTTALAACGGHAADIAEQPSPPADGGSDGAVPTPQPVPGDGGFLDASDASTTDGGSLDATTADAGCGPVLVSQGNNCSDVYRQPCGVPQGVNPDDGMSQEECNKVCGTRTGGGSYWGCGVHLLADLPGPSFDCYTCVEGRRPHGYVDPPFEPTIGGWLAHAADLERVSIDAFQILRRELEHHGAPAALVARAARAETDEVRHARVLGALARREGATLTNAPVPQGEVRALLDIALENAVEGCVRETYGALVAGFQAQHAGRTEIRRLMKQIYRDESSHADLAWSVHEWILARLAPSERALVMTAMVHAVAALDSAARAPAAPALVDALGLPPPRDAGRLVAGLAAQLWKPALAAIAA
jgi:hypothetical protein